LRLLENELVLKFTLLVDCAALIGSTKLTNFLMVSGRVLILGTSELFAYTMLLIS